MEETVAILERVRPQYEDFHGVVFSKEALDAAARLSWRYVADSFLPDKVGLEEGLWLGWGCGSSPTAFCPARHPCAASASGEVLGLRGCYSECGLNVGLNEHHSMRMCHVNRFCGCLVSGH